MNLRGIQKFFPLHTIYVIKSSCSGFTSQEWKPKIKTLSAYIEQLVHLPNFPARKRKTSFLIWNIKESLHTRIGKSSCLLPWNLIKCLSKEGVSKFIITVGHNKSSGRGGNFYYLEMCPVNNMFSTFIIAYNSFPTEGLKCAEKQKSRENYLLALSLYCN